MASRAALQRESAAVGPNAGKDESPPSRKPSRSISGTRRLAQRLGAADALARLSAAGSVAGSPERNLADLDGPRTARPCDVPSRASRHAHRSIIDRRTTTGLSAGWPPQLSWPLLFSLGIVGSVRRQIGRTAAALAARRRGRLGVGLVVVAFAEHSRTGHRAARAPWPPPTRRWPSTPSLARNRGPDGAIAALRSAAGDRPA